MKNAYEIPSDQWEEIVRLYQGSEGCQKSGNAEQSSLLPEWEDMTALSEEDHV